MQTFFSKVIIAFAILHWSAKYQCESASVNVTVEETTTENFGPDQASPNGEKNQYLPVEEDVRNNTLIEETFFVAEVFRSVVFAYPKCPKGQEFTNGECRQTIQIGNFMGT